MAIIDDIREKIASGQFEFSQHAVDQSIVCHISIQELREAIDTGEVIEDYPTDKYGPSCLVFGVTLARRPLHVQCHYPSRLFNAYRTGDLPTPPVALRRLQICPQCL
jgi:hypothetical protein